MIDYFLVWLSLVAVNTSYYIEFFRSLYSMNFIIISYLLVILKDNLEIIFSWIFMFWIHTDYGVFALELLAKDLKTIARPLRMHGLETSTN